MTVVCNNDGCSYNSSNHFCTKLTTFIDENGMCKEHWVHGSRVPPKSNVEPQHMQEYYGIKKED